MKKKPEYKLMNDKVNSSILMNGGKILPSILIYFLLFSALVFAFFVLPLCAFLVKSGLTEAVLQMDVAKIQSVISGRTEIILDVSALVMASLFFIVATFLFFGLVTIMVRIARKDNVTVGFMFIGFRKFKETFPLVMIIFSQQVIAVLFTFGAALLLGRFMDLSNEKIAVLYSFLVSGLFVLFFCLLLIPFIFLFPSILTRKGYSISKSVKESVDVIGGRFFHFIGFLLYSGGHHLLNGIFYFIIATLFTIKPVPGGNFLSFLFELSYMMAFINAGIRMSIAYPVYFLSVTQENFLRKPDFNIITPDEMKIFGEPGHFVDITDEAVDVESEDVTGTGEAVESSETEDADGETDDSCISSDGSTGECEKNAGTDTECEGEDSRTDGGNESNS